MSDLATIRRAYRYVVAYERRVLDTITQIDESVREGGFERVKPHGWSPLYRAFPSKSWSADSWAWDNVPNYICRYSWERGEQNTVGAIRVLVDHVADSAFEAKILSRVGLPELDPLTELGEPEKSRSLLRCLVVETVAPLPAATWKLYWHQIFAAEFSVPALNVLQPPTAIAHRESAGLRLTVSTVDLESFEDGATITERLLAPLRDVVARRA